MPQPYALPGGQCKTNYCENGVQTSIILPSGVECLLKKSNRQGMETREGNCKCPNACVVSTRNRKNWCPAIVRNVFRTQNA
jgi:hypothetical protein